MTPKQQEQLSDALGFLPGNLTDRWEVWTSNSYRRVTARDQTGRMVTADGGVLSGTIQRSDNCPDLSMSEEQLRALCTLRNVVADILSSADTPEAAKCT